MTLNPSEGQATITLLHIVEPVGQELRRNISRERLIEEMSEVGECQIRKLVDVIWGEEIVTDIVVAGGKPYQQIVNEAKEKAKAEANKIMLDAQFAIETQKMAAITEVKNQVGNLVIEVSEKILRRELSNKSEQEKYIKQLSEEVKLN